MTVRIKWELTQRARLTASRDESFGAGVERACLERRNPHAETLRPFGGVGLHVRNLDRFIIDELVGFDCDQSPLRVPREAHCPNAPLLLDW